MTRPAHPLLPLPEPTQIACPHWCTRGHGHPYATHDEGFRRVHHASLADLEAWGLALTVDQVELAASPEGPIDRDPASRQSAWLGPLAIDYEGQACTGADLRAMAASLARAADELDSLNRLLDA
jgi:hypothetical protein